MIDSCHTPPRARGRFLWLVLAAAVVVAAPALVAAQEDEDAAAAPEAKGGLFGALSYRYIGPPGNRVSAVVGVSGDPSTYYVGAASGGVWKSTDGGVHWKPVFDEQTAQSIGSIAIAPSDPNVVWVGTGETFIRSNVSLGDGIYKSTDAGKTWTRMGLEKTGRIGRIVIDPRNPDVVLAAALGHGYGPQPERGVYRTTDGGKTWERALFVDENTGISDLTMDANNPRVLFAGAWQIDIKTWGRTSGGPGSGVFVSRDGGATWKRITGHGLPDPPLGKIAVAVAPSDSSRVYALIETGDRGSLWRSDDGGERWHLVNHSRLLNERPHYYTRMLVMPDNADEVYFPSNGMGATKDGGVTADQVRWGGDNHDMWADPKDANRLMIGNDLGVMISTVRGREWHTMRLPIGQIYHVATDRRVPYFVYGHMQDYASLRGPSNSLSGESIHPSLWTTTAGCETGWNIPDPVDPDVVWGGCYAGVVERFDLRTHRARTVSPWPERTMGANAGEIKLRMNWTFPIAISPHDHEVVYVGSQYVHRTSDAGQTWTTISPDLTLNDRSMMGDSGGLTVDNLSVEYAGVVFAIAESPREKGQIWAGTNDGLLQMTRDNGKTWTNVTPHLTGLPPKGTVSSIEPSRHDPGVCYVAIDLHQVNNRDPFVYKTADYGKTWKAIGGGIPRSALSYAHVVREDPVRRGLLYLGTENGLYVSFDDGARWEPLQNNLPHAPVHWIDVQETFGDLVVGTYGRGIWILDDLSPLRQMTDAVRSASTLFSPRAAYRFRARERRDLAPSGTGPGRNPAYGASLDYYLPSETKADVVVKVLDKDGREVRSLKGTKRAGVNRVDWDLCYEPTREVALRTTPPGNPHLWEEKRFSGKDTRGVFYYGIENPKKGPLVAPGTYTVKLVAEGRELTQPLTVLKDPETAGSEADVAESTRFALDVYKAINEAADMINQLEWTGKQVEDLKKALAAAKAAPAAIDDATAFEAKRRRVLDQLLQPTLAEADLKSFRGPLKLYLSFVWLQAESGTGGGDVSGSSDYPPTAAEKEVYEKLARELASARTDFKRFYDEDVPAFGKQLQERGVGPLVAVPPPPAAH
jgi:photosystem II stability/assembly factor-like uncharacterized protein